MRAYELVIRQIEDQILAEFQSRRTPFVVVLNKVDRHPGEVPAPERLVAPSEDNDPLHSSLSTPAP